MTLDAQGGGSQSHAGGLASGWPDLREGETSFRALFETSPIPMWIYAVDDLRFLRVNAAAVHGYGWTEEAFLARTLVDIPPAEDRARVAALARAERIDPSPSGPFRHLDAMGRVRIVETATCPVRYRGRDARLAVVWNVTDRHGAAQALRDAQRLARLGTWRLEGGTPATAADHAAPEPHLVLSPELAQMLGMGAQTRLPMTALGGLVHPEDLDAVSAAAAACSATGAAFDHEFRFQRPDGRPMHLRCAGQRGRGVPDGEPAPPGILLEGFCQDVTDQREAEAALRQAEKLSAMGQLTGGVAHDFNNLLTVVSANIQLALESVAEGESRRALEAAAAAAERGAALTSQLLSFARRQPLRPRALALGPFLDGFAGLVSRLIGDTHPLRVSVDPAGPAGLGALCDPAQFESALLNLVLNARDAMPGGGPIRIEATSGPGDLVAVRVHDTGTGMSPEIMARVLEPFFTTKPPGKGTGLGLSMALGFARQSGGDLRVESTLGRGSTLSLLLPRASIAAVEGAFAELATGVPAIAVLIVEDDPAVRAVATTIFERFGARVAAVESGEEALALLDGGQPCDLMFSDIVLGPGMDGFALGRAVRAAHPGIAVLFTSGYNEASEECARSPELSGCELLPKPYAIGPLRAAVLRALAAVR